MCTRIRDFYNSNKYAILWTVGYVIATWAIMRYMFNFNIFSVVRWHQLMHAHLHGFAGFVFGILILAMVPLYVATTVIIVRSKEPLFNFKLTIPEFIKIFFKNAFAQTPIQDDIQPETALLNETKNESDIELDNSTETEPTPAPIPATVPPEMRVAYERARDHITHIQTSAFDLGNITKKTVPAIETTTAPATESEMPIPTSFDINDTPDIIDDVPVFTDLDFDDDNEPDQEKQVTQIDDIKTTTGNVDIVSKYLTARSVPHTIENDIVITDTFAIVSHTDSDFWVADNESWFAAGKIRKSPITTVLESAATHHVQPVLYLGTDNIMDINDLRDIWERAGIRIITDLKDLF